MVTRIPGCTWRPIQHNYTARRRPGTDGAVVHVTAAPNATSQFGWFNNPAAQASSHVHVDIYGKSEQYVDADLIAWCQREGNLRYLSIETQGGADGQWTVAQAAEVLRILAWAAKHYGFPLADMLTSRPGARGVGVHRYGIDPWRVSGGQVWGGRGKVCPGNERYAQFKRSGFLKGDTGGGSTPAPAPAPTRHAMGWPVLTFGMVSDDVHALQTFLRSRGWNIAADRSFGPATRQAVREYQAQRGLAIDGAVGPATQADMKALGTGTSTPKPPAAGKKRAPKMPPVIKPGARGGWVGLWQKVLRANGHNVAVDESNGPATQAATKRWQAARGLAADAYVGPRTWVRALLADANGALTRGDSGPHVEVWQNFLGVATDGSFGPATEDATREVQRFLGITADGAAGPATNAALRKHFGL